MLCANSIDRSDNPGKAQPCWHRATDVTEKQVGETSPVLVTAITQEAKALRRLGRTAEAQSLEQRSAKLKQAAQQN
jgi:hypothetical protein